MVFNMLKFIILPIIIIYIFGSAYLHNHELVKLPPLPTYDELLLLPLDSRPVCSTMVQKLGKLAGINVIVPPKELLDNYQEPADRKKLWSWLQKETSQGKNSIVSADILLHGSLLQTRQHVATEVEQTEFLEELRKLQEQTPPNYNSMTNQARGNTAGQFQLNLFSVIPRLLVSDEIYPDCWYQWHLMRYSQLLDLVETSGDYAMTNELLEYKEEIPAEILNKYTNIFTQSRSFNEKLLEQLAALLSTDKAQAIYSPSSETLGSAKPSSPLFIIGQDDSSPFGLPKMTATHLERQIEEKQLQDRALLTNGADEIALLLLARHFLQQSQWQPKLYLHYGLPNTEFKHMPYMAASTGATLRNQAQLVGAQIVESPAAADIVLFVHCGDNDAKPTAGEVEQLAKYLKQNKRIALIDLSANFEAEEMLLPKLLEQNVPINRLAAYAGWNTFSNSSGTAIAQSVIFAGRLRQLEQNEATQSFTSYSRKKHALQAKNSTEGASEGHSPNNEVAIAALYAANLNFTAERMLEDYYYQKLIHPELRPYLESFGTTPTDLEPEEKTQTEYRIQERLALYASWLLWRSLGRAPFYADANQAYYLADLTVGSKLPWNRIFEVDLNVHSQVSCKPKS